MLLVAVCSLMMGAQERSSTAAEYLNRAGGTERFAMIQKRIEPLEPPKLSPRKFPPRNERWEFPWLTTGFAQTRPGQYDLRFRVYSQQRSDRNDKANAVARMGLRLWEMLSSKLRADHMETQRGVRFVDVYLAWGGEPGAEQAFVEDREGSFVRQVSTITFFDMASFNNPTEMAREMAHEYGHAVLPAIGGFETPEDWANGFMGEKLFMVWLRDAMSKGHISSDDVMGAKLADLNRWVAAHATPLLKKAAGQAPDTKLIGGKGQKSMDAFLGLVLYAEEILSDKDFSRSLRLTGSMKAADYPNALVLTVSEADTNLTVPKDLKGSAIWIPLGKATIKNAKVLQKAGNWAKVQPLGSTVSLIAPKEVTGR